MRPVVANHTHIISKDSPAYQPCRLPPHATRAPLVGGNIYVLVGLEKIPVSAQGKGKEALRSHSLVARRLMFFSSTLPLEDLRGTFLPGPASWLISALS